MPRLTRAESQARTREELLKTAREMFLRDGYYATSLDKVAEAAGFSKGAVYSNFRNKDELCLAVLDAIRAERAEEIGELLQAGPGASMEERMGRFEAWAERVVGDPEWTLLELEFATQARRDEQLRRELADRFDRLSTLTGAAVAHAVEAEGVTPPMPPEQIAVALLSLGVGLGLFRAADPGLSVRALVDTVRVMAGLPVGGGD